MSSTTAEGLNGHPHSPSALACFPLQATCLSSLLAMSVQVGFASEADTASPQDGWAVSGSIKVGAVETWTNSRVDPKNGSINTSLTGDQDHGHGTDLYVLLDLHVDAPSGLGLYLTTPVDADEYGFAVGATMPTAIGEWDIHGFGGVPDQVWENPYLVGSPRTETDRFLFGGGFGLRAIGGTPFELSYAYRQRQIDDDNIGQAQPLLAREGQIHRLALTAPLMVGGCFWEAGLEYERADLDGDAAAYDAGAASLSWAVPWQRWQLVMTGELGYGQHRASHPIFGVRREDLVYGASAMFTHTDAFGLSGMEVGVLTAWSKEDSNCEFYDAQSIYIGALIGYTLN